MRIRRPQVTAMLEHARHGYPFEVCGVLLGEGSRVAAIVPAIAGGRGPARASR